MTNDPVAGSIDVGQQPSVIVASHDVALEPNGCACREQRGGVLLGLIAEALGGIGRAVGRIDRVGDLWRVDADQAHPFGPASDLDVDRVAVDDVSTVSVGSATDGVAVAPPGSETSTGATADEQQWTPQR